MSGDYGGGFGGQRGNFNNQGMPMHQMGMNNQGPMMNYQQQQMMNQMGGRPDQMMQQQQQQQQPVPPQMQQQQPQQQQQQMVQNPNMNQNNIPSLNTPVVPNAPQIPNMMDTGVPQQQQQQQHPAGNPQPPAPTGNPQLGQQITQNQFNPVTLCKFAQETVQEIVCRFQEIFQTLRQSTPPNGTSQGTMEKKVQEQLRSIRLLFKRIRLLYDRCNDGGQISMEYTQVESLIPYKDELDNRPDPPHGEEYKKAVAENRELLDQLSVKNKQLREVIDRLRIMIWEINTMLSMRRS